MEVEKYVADKVLELCEKNHMSRYQLSARTGISQSVLSDIINRKNLPTLITLEKICRAFLISLSEFFEDGAERVPARLTKEQTEVLALWKSLSKEEQHFVITCMKSLKK